MHNPMIKKADEIRQKAYQRIMRNRRVMSLSDAVRMMRRACKRAWDIERSG